jgi:hypothetical protein
MSVVDRVDDISVPEVPLEPSSTLVTAIVIPFETLVDQGRGLPMETIGTSDAGFGRPFSGYSVNV